MALQEVNMPSAIKPKADLLKLMFSRITAVRLKDEMTSVIFKEYRYLERGEHYGLLVVQLVAQNGYVLTTTSAKFIDYDELQAAVQLACAREHTHITMLLEIQTRGMKGTKTNDH